MFPSSLLDTLNWHRHASLLCVLVKAAFKEVGVSVFSSFWVIQQVCKESFGCSICAILRFPENAPIWHLLSSHILFLWLLGNQDPCSINYLDKPSICRIDPWWYYSWYSFKKKHTHESNIHASVKLTVNNLGLTDKYFSTFKQHPDFLFHDGFIQVYGNSQAPTLPYGICILRRRRDNAGRVHVTQLQCVEHSSVLRCLASWRHLFPSMIL